MSYSDYTKKISRRQFLKTTGLGVAAAGLGSMAGSEVAKYILDKDSTGTLNQVTGMQTGTSSADYYVDPANGSNSNSGTSENNALKDFSEFASGGSIGLQAGDRVVVKPNGTISSNDNSESILSLSSLGSSGSDKIIIESSTNEKVRIDGSGAKRGVDISNSVNVHVKDMYVSNTQAEGFFVLDSEQITVEHCVGDTCGNNLSLAAPNTYKLYTSFNCLITNCRSENNQNENGDGFTCSGDSGGNRIEYCVSIHDRDGGFDCYGAAPNNANTFYKCIAAHAGITREGTTDGGNGVGFKSGSSEGTGGNQIYQKCVAYKCTEGNAPYGFDTNDTGRGSEYYNCVAYDCGIGFRLESENNSDDVVKNCIAVQNEETITQGGSEDISDNSWNLGIDNPQFRSTELGNDNFMELQDGSPCIDAGTDIGLEYSGTAPDLGANEKGLNIPLGITSQSTTGDTSGGSTSPDQETGGQTEGSSSSGSISFDPEAVGWASKDWFRKAANDGSLQIIKITSTNPEEFKQAVNTSGPTLIVFEVGGVWDFGGPHFEMESDKTYVAGQTAPEPGVHFIKTSLDIAGNDTVFEHIAVRPGDQVDSPGQADGITVQSGTDNVIVNHCSLAWATDENITIDDGCSNVTVANTFVSNTLFNGPHPEGDHSMGFMFDTELENVSGVGNLVANHEWRSPRFAGTGHVYWANNYVYNFVSRGFGLFEGASATVIGNYYEKGGKDDKSALMHDGTTTLYVEDNIEQSNTPSFEGDGEAGGEVVNSPIQQPSGFSPLPASETKKHVLNNSGMRPAQRTAYDQQLVQNIRNGSSDLIDSQSEVGGYPDYQTTIREITTPQPSEAVSWLENYTFTVQNGGSRSGGTTAPGGDTGTGGNNDSGTVGGGPTGSSGSVETQGTQTLVIDTSSSQDFGYQFTVDGEVSKTETPQVQAEGDDSIEQLSNGVYRVTGSTGGDLGDAFEVNGTISDFSADTSGGFSILLDGQDITSQLTGSSSSGLFGGTQNTIELIGGDADNTLQYMFYTNGKVTKNDEHGGPSPSDRVFTSKVVGKTAGGHDGYIVHGQITEFYAEDGITIILNGQEMSPSEFKQTDVCSIQ